MNIEITKVYGADVCLDGGSTLCLSTPAMAISMNSLSKFKEIVSQEYLEPWMYRGGVNDGDGKQVGSDETLMAT